ncbi:septin-5-like isoform X2 [Anoplopoma fimbria]|uniref:septin-5-like isoform X2 n=1 Tax=Anoplopoma fimbria TaxID=229290 RepID=UPI0023ED2936|nr:septin-5-like isoform X2 [Anoplopoma fimbria]
MDSYIYVFCHETNRWTVYIGTSCLAMYEASRSQGEFEEPSASCSTCHLRSGSAAVRKLSSLSIGDQENTPFPFAIRDLPPISQPGDRHQTPHDQAPVHHEAEGTETATNGLPTLPGTPTVPHAILCNPAGSPTVPHRPSRMGENANLQPVALRRQLVSQVSMDCPLSPASRPQSPWGRFDPNDPREDQDKEYVGFATLPNQVHRKTVKKGFTFTLLVAGESGLGKSTLINSLFLTDLYKDRKVPNAQERIDQTVNIVKHTISIEEKGIKVRLSIIDTPGFGDAVNDTDSWKPIEDYIDQQFEQYFRDESGLNRRNIPDNRVHCCLYFISPFGHGLRPLDVACMKALHNKVNIVPVVAKADSLTQAEVYRKKLKIRQEIEQFGINIYQFPECDSDEDEDFKKQDQILKDSIPFAVIGSNVQVESEGLEKPAHSDFLLLRNMLVRTHMQDLKDVTGETHYENYRAQCIENMTRMVVQERKRSLREKHRDPSEADVPLPLAPADNQTERLLLQKDEELRRMQEVLERVQEHMLHGQRGGF